MIGIQRVITVNKESKTSSGAEALVTLKAIAFDIYSGGENIMMTKKVAPFVKGRITNSLTQINYWEVCCMTHFPIFFFRRNPVQWTTDFYGQEDRKKI